MKLAPEGGVDAGWASVLEDVPDDFTAVSRFLDDEVAAGRRFLPVPERVLRVFTSPLDQVRVVIVGQDPYPTPGVPVGLSFSMNRSVRPIARSLANIYRELHDDLGIDPPTHGDLSQWNRNGVLLLNRVLTVTPGLPGSHRGKGWEAITDHAIRSLVARDQPLVAILWGKDAQSLTPLLGSTPIIASPHPSPLSASRGFFGSRPFSRANELLVAAGGAPIDWALD